MVHVDFPLWLRLTHVFNILKSVSMAERWNWIAA
jgi:hypothetical protein